MQGINRNMAQPNKSNSEESPLEIDESPRSTNPDLPPPTPEICVEQVSPEPHDQDISVVSTLHHDDFSKTIHLPQTSAMVNPKITLQPPSVGMSSNSIIPSNPSHLTTFRNRNIEKTPLGKTHSAPNGLSLFRQKTIQSEYDFTKITTGSLDHPHSTATTHASATQRSNAVQPVEIPSIDILKQGDAADFSMVQKDDSTRNSICKMLAYFVQNTTIFKGKNIPVLSKLVTNVNSDYHYYWIITQNSVLEGKTGPSCTPTHHIITYNDRLRLPWVCHNCKRRGMTLSDVILHVAVEHRKHKIVVHDTDGKSISEFLMKIHDDYVKEMERFRQQNNHVLPSNSVVSTSAPNASPMPSEISPNSLIMRNLSIASQQQFLNATQALITPSPQSTLPLMPQTSPALVTSLASTVGLPTQAAYVSGAKPHLLKTESTDNRVMRSHPPLGKTRSMSPYMLSSSRGASRQPSLLSGQGSLDIGNVHQMASGSRVSVPLPSVSPSGLPTMVPGGLPGTGQLPSAIASQMVAGLLESHGNAQTNSSKYRAGKSKYEAMTIYYNQKNDMDRAEIRQVMKEQKNTLDVESIKKKVEAKDSGFSETHQHNALPTLVNALPNNNQIDREMLQQIKNEIMVSRGVLNTSSMHDTLALNNPGLLSTSACSTPLKRRSLCQSLSFEDNQMQEHVRALYAIQNGLNAKTNMALSERMDTDQPPSIPAITYTLVDPEAHYLTVDEEISNQSDGIIKMTRHNMGYQKLYNTTSAQQNAAAATSRSNTLQRKSPFQQTPIRLNTSNGLIKKMPLKASASYSPPPIKSPLCGKASCPSGLLGGEAGPAGVDRSEPLLSDLSSLYKHTLQFKLIESDFSCAMCDFVCTTEDVMQDHIQSHSLRDVISYRKKLNQAPKSSI